MKEKSTPAEEVRQQMRKLRDQKTSELAEADARLNEARMAVQEARTRSEEMTAIMDLDGYTKAQEDLKKATIAEQMYKGKIDQLQAKRYITEAESDAVIDSLLAYEDTLGQSFETILGTKLKELKKAMDSYRTEIQNVEDLITEWCGSVYPNYRSATSTYTDADGNTTNRFPTPRPVHLVPFTGNSASEMLNDFLNKMWRFLED